MSRIGGLGYKLYADNAGFDSAMKLSRAEFNLMRREIRNNESDIEKHARKMDVLNRGFETGAISVEEYTRTQARLAAETAEAKAEAELNARLMREAAELTRALATEEERLAEKARQLEQIKPHLSTELYNRAVQDLTSKLPENVAAERDRSAAMAEAERLTRSLMTEEERHAEQLTRLEHLKPHLSIEMYDRAMADLAAKLPSNVSAETQLAEARREAEQIARGLMTEEERLAAEREQLMRLQPHLGEELYARAIADVDARMPAAVAAALDLENARRQADDITRRMMTSEERLTAEREQLLQLRPHLSEQAYARAIADVDARMPGAIAAADDLENARRQAEAITQRLTTEEERLAAEREQLMRLQPHLSEEMYGRAIAEVDARMPAAIAAARDLENARRQADEITKRLMTDEERLAAERQQLIALRPHLSEDAYARAIADVDARMPAAIAHERQRASEIERAKAITASTESATERYAREIDELNRLLRQGDISHQTYSRAMRRTKADMDAHRNQVLSHIPGVSQLNGVIGGMPPGFAAAAAGAASLGIALQVVHRVASHVTEQVSLQMQEVDRMAKQARLLSMTQLDLAGMRLAGSEFAGMEDNQVDVAIQKMMTRVAEAATGSGAAVNVLEMLGLDAETLATQNPMDVLQQIATGFQNIKDPAQQLPAAMQLFEEEGVKMVAVLRQGPEALDQSVLAAKSLGMALDGVDAEQIEAANDALGRMNTAIDGIYKNIAVEVAPAINDLAPQFEFQSRKFATAVEHIANGFRLLKADATDAYNAVVGLTTFDYRQAETGVNNFARNATIEAIRQEGRDRAAREKALAAEEEKNRAEKVKADAEKAKQAKLPEFDIDNEITQLRERNRELEIGADAYALEQASKANMDLTLIMELAQLQQRNKEIETAKRLEKEREEAIKENARRVEQERDQLMQRGEQLAESHRTPYEQLVSEIRDAQQLLSAGAINSTTYEREMAAARKRFAEADQRQNQRREAKAIETGSREDYQARIAMANQQRTEEDARHKAAQAMRQAQVDAILQLVNADSPPAPESV